MAFTPEKPVTSPGGRRGFVQVRRREGGTGGPTRLPSTEGLSVMHASDLGPALSISTPGVSGEGPISASCELYRTQSPTLKPSDEVKGFVR